MRIFFFFFKQKTAYEILTCDWSSDVCSSDLIPNFVLQGTKSFGMRKERPRLDSFVSSKECHFTGDDDYPQIVCSSKY